MDVHLQIPRRPPDARPVVCIHENVRRAAVRKDAKTAGSALFAYEIVSGERERFHGANHQTEKGQKDSYSHAFNAPE
jgi:hypothetical protein